MSSANRTSIAAALLALAMGICGCAVNPVAGPGLSPSAAALVQRASTGDAHAQAQAGASYFLGKNGFPKDPAQAVTWLKLSAGQGDPGAANLLGIVYATGTGVPQSFADAKQWYDLAIRHGNAEAEYNLGIAYRKGQGTAVDYGEALRWFRTAADHNFAPAKLALGQMYLEGQGVTRDEAEGAYWVRAAAVQGNISAQAFLATMYDSGRGVEQNDVLAYEWSDLASARAPDPLAALLREQRNREALRLTPVTLAAAQSAASQWKPGSELASPVLTPEDAAAAAAHRSVRSSGSGFIVGKSGEIATDNHVVAACGEIRVHDAAGKLNVATRLIAREPADDLAMLSSVGFGSHLRLQAKPVQQGENIATYGFPLAPMLAAGGNLTTGTVSAVGGLSGDPRSFQISAPVQPGSSGGPVIDEGGAVVGIVQSKLNALALAAVTGDVAQNVNFAMKVQPLRRLMDAHGLGYETAAGGTRYQTVELAELLQKATVKVECWR